ncbi:hypothetical protein [Carboxylicivirga sp. N1Y90]|uniref:hypothetical protein n=1 Tax=Carboxylicivirga fragile TaxID=3417571 RepID=UPI003D353005|nr:hypothetical protein [Marinilabiliaceae bacterium N1Y90]
MKKEKLLVSAIQSWLSNNNINLLNPQNEFLYIPNEACSVCIEGHLIRLNESKIKKTIILCESDDWVKYVENLGRIYHGEFRYVRVTPFSNSDFSDIVHISIINNGVGKVSIIKL